jgi:amidohydrolase
MENKEKLLQIIDQLKNELIGLGRSIHENPELSNLEFKAANLIKEALENHGFQVETGIAGMRTALKAVHNPAGYPAIAFLGEYDALPGIGHACGHNLISPASIGAAIALSRVYPQAKIIFIGTPGEETGAGKAIMAEAGVFAGLDAVMMVHPNDRYIADFKSLAMDALEFTYLGKASHAAAAPHQGINALDAAIQTFNGINALRQHVTEDVRIHGIISEGGLAANIIPERAQARFYVRAARRETVKEVAEKVKNCARAGALSAGAEVEIRYYENSNDDMRSNRVLVECFTANLKRLGIEKIAQAGKPSGSSDMGNVSHVAPSLHGMVAICEEGIAAHTKEFCEAANSPSGFAGMLIGAKALALTGADLIEDAEVLKRVKEEFQMMKDK